MRLIDADAMKEWLDEYLSVFKKYDKSEVKGFVDHAPTIEQKKGHWIYHPDDLFPAESTQECSVCHEEEFMSLCNENFCPYCGADMKGADDE